MALHLVVVLLFQLHTNCMLHAPGRCIPQVIIHLQEFVTEEAFEKLNSYQALVMMQLSSSKVPSEDKGDSEEPESSIGSLLAEGLLEIKRLATKPKKSGTE